MASRQSNVFLRALFATEVVTPTANAVPDDDSDDEIGAWIWRSARAAASLATADDADAPPSSACRTASLPVPGNRDTAKKSCLDDGGDESGAVQGGAAASEGERVEDRPAAPKRQTFARGGSPGTANRTEAGRRYPMRDRKAVSSNCEILTTDPAANGTEAGRRYPIRERKAVSSNREIPDTDGDGDVPRKRSRRSVQKRSRGGASTTTTGGVGIVNRDEVKHCTHEGCVKTARAGGVCYKHGSMRKVCNHDGCTLHAHQGGLCFQHGAKHKHYRHDGCTHRALRGHWRKRKVCSHDACTRYVRQGGVCFKHGAKRKPNVCPRRGCNNKVAEHGAKV